MERGRFNYILEKCKDKRVLHIGCVDEGLTLERLENGNLLHIKLSKITNELHGLDISREGLKILWKAGYGNLQEIDIEQPFVIGDRFDIVVISEVLEHLNNPGLALDNLKKLNTQEFIFSVPSAFLRFNEHKDHNFYFTTQSIRTLLEKHGYEIKEIKGYAFSRLTLWPDGYLIWTTQK